MIQFTNFWRPEFLITLSCLALLAWPGHPARAEAAAGSVTGSWCNADLQIEITSTASGVEGVIAFRGQKYPFAGTVAANQIAGAFRSGNETFEFSASLNGDSLNFTTGGKTYSLARDAVKPKINPLGADAQARPNPLGIEPPTPAKPGIAAPKIDWGQYTLPDPYLRCTAWTFVAPTNWKFEGGVSWTGRLIPGPAYSTSLSVHSPDAALEYQLFPIFMFMETNNRMLAGGSEVLRVQDPLDCITRIIIPRCRGEIRDVKVISSEKLPKMAEEVLTNARSSGLQLDGLKVMSARALVQYTLRGKPMEEMFYCTVAAMANPRMGVTSWAIDRAFSYRAEKGNLEPSMALLGTIGSSMRENPEWVAARRRELQRIVAAASTPPRIPAGSRGPSILDVSKSMSHDQDTFLKGLDASANMRDHALQAGTYAPRNTQVMTDPVLGENIEVANGYLHYYRDYYGQIHGSDLNASDFYTQFKMNVTEMQERR